MIGCRLTPISFPAPIVSESRSTIVPLGEQEIAVQPECVKFFTSLLKSSLKELLRLIQMTESLPIKQGCSYETLGVSWGQVDGSIIELLCLRYVIPVQVYKAAVSPECRRK